MNYKEFSISEILQSFLPANLYMFVCKNINTQCWEKIYVPKNSLIKLFPKNYDFKNAPYEFHFKPMSENQKSPYIFVDDLSKNKIKKMLNDNIKPKLIIETSPENYQVWLHFNKKLTDEERHELSRYITTKYEGDHGAIASSHFGRLPFFYREKNNEKFLVNIAGYSNFICNTPIIKKESNQQQSLKKYLTQKPSSSAEHDDIMQYAKNIQLKLEQIISDQSRIDYIMALRLLKKYSPSEVENAIFYTSPNIEKRKKKHVMQYIHRTVENAKKIDNGTSMSNFYFQ